MQDALFGGTDAAQTLHTDQLHSQSVEQLRRGKPRLRLADRSQVGMHLCSIDELVPVDHKVRVIWDAVCQMDLSGFVEPVRAREFTEGRPANDPRVMVGLWLWAAVNGIARGRVVARLCDRDLSFKWMCGGLGMNYHTINDFRVGHQEALDKLFTQVLDKLFTQVLGKLTHAGLVTVNRISQPIRLRSGGLRVRASAGRSSFHTRPTLEKCLAEAEAHLGDLKKAADLPENQEALEQDRVLETALAEDRLERVKAALVEVGKVEESKAGQRGEKGKRPARASTTDPEARTMKMPNGGFNPAYNVQFASDPISRAIVGVFVSNSGTDTPLSTQMRQQVEDRTGGKVKEHLIDGGYVDHDQIDTAAAADVTLYMPVPKPAANAREQDRFAPRKSDSESVAAWRAQMKTDEAKEIYLQRAATSERVNADLRDQRGMAPFSVRGIAKVTCVALWSALAYTIMTFPSALT
jgi:transposase